MDKMELQKELKIVRIPVKLPYDSKKTLDDYLIALLIKDSNQAKDILNNHLIKKESKYARYFKPYIYTDKIFNKVVRKKMKAEEKADLNEIAKNMKLSFFNKTASIKNKNVIVDTSDMQSAFIEYSAGRNYKAICESYIEHLAYFLNTACSGLNQSHRYLFINTLDWGINESNKAKVLSTNQRLINPISIIYYLLIKNIDALAPLDNYTLVVFDGETSWFKWSIKNRDKKTYSIIYKLIGKFNSKTVDLDSLSESDAEVANKVAAIAVNTTKSDDEENKEETSSPSKDTTSKEEDIDDKEEMNKDELELAKKAIEDNYDEISNTLAYNKRLEKLRKRQRSLKIDNISLADLEDDKPEDLHIETDDISDKLFTPVESVKKIRFSNMNRSYNKNLRERDIINVFRSLNKRSLPVMITKIERKNTSTPMDLKETWTVKMISADGVSHSVTVDLPIPYDDNYLFLGGNKKQLINQQFLKPIIKISPDTVQVCTNYNKIFVYRYGDVLSPKVTIFKKIIKDHPELFKVTYGNGTSFSHGHLTSIEYDSLAKDFIDITIRSKGIGLKFNQEFFDKKVKEKEIEAIDNDEFLYCIWDNRSGAKVKAWPFSLNSTFGTDIDGPIDLFVETYKRETGEDFWSLAGPGDKPGKRFMYSFCKVMTKAIPTVIFLGYFEGLSTVLRKAGIDYTFSDKRPRTNSPDESVIQFADGYLTFKRKPIENSLLLSGLMLYDTRGYNFDDFDTKSPYLDIFETNFGSRILASGLDAYYDNMIDPISEEILKQMDLPTDFVQLMLTANELLADNNYSSELSLTEFRVRNMEMISAFLYKEIANAYSNYKRHAKEKNPDKISIPKNQVIKDILTSNIIEEVSIINPVTEKEKQNNITCKGPSGINLIRAYTQEKRSYHDSMTGAIAVSTSPDANCGLMRHLTVEPKVVNARGFFDCKEPPKDMNATRLFSYSELVNGVGVTMDDSIRTAMASKQNSHLIPVRDMSPVLLSTGVEKLIPYTCSKDFVVRAKDDGVVKEYNQKTGIMILEYKDKTHEAVNLNPMVVKNGGGGFYLEDKLLPMYKVGQRFKKDNIIAQNKDYFGYHYDGSKMNLGTLTKIAVMSSYATFEDSNAVTESLTKRMATEMIMKKNIVLGKNANVSQIVKVGDPIKVGDPLITFEQSNEDESVNKLLSNIGSDLKEEIKDFATNTLVSKYAGTIEEIRIYTTEEPDTLSPSLGKIVKDYWKKIREKKNLIRKYKITDPTYQGNTFFEVDGPIKADSAGKVKGYKINEGVIIEFYIKFFDAMKPGDKIAHQLALKGTISLVIPDDKAPYAVGTPDEPIEASVPASSILARMVPGIIPTMFVGKLLVNLKKQLKKMYTE